ncbi:MAG: hypothetical protein WC378_09135 [Opitutaceae bacterium]|jgi:predicted RNase H-like nuclease (RuvC/YqgF family)
MKVIPLALIVLASVLATLSTILFITARSANLRTEAFLAIAEARIRRLESEATAKQTRYDAIQAQLAQFEDAKTQLATAEQRIADLNDSLSKTRNLLLVRVQNETLLNREIADANRALEAARALAAELERCKARINELEQTLAILRRRGIDIQTDASAPSATVVVVGPENAFVVFNLGAKQGIAVNQKLLIRRGTDVIATVLTSDVRDDMSIAQVDPSTLRTALHKGDSILFDK